MTNEPRLIFLVLRDDFDHGDKFVSAWSTVELAEAEAQRLNAERWSDPHFVEQDEMDPARE